MRKYIFALALVFCINCMATVRILTFHYNQADFVEMQYKALKQFLQDDFELIVFNDAKTLENEKGIENACKMHGIQCVRYQSEWHLTNPLNTYLKARLHESSTIGLWGWNELTTIEEIANCPSVRHSHVIQYALDHYGYDHDDIVVIMDGDNFLIKPLSIRALLGDYDIIGFNQLPDYFGKRRKQLQISVPKNTEMLWVVFIAFRPSMLFNPRELQFHVDVVSGQPLLPHNTVGDTGSAVYKYLRKYPDLKILAYPWQDSGIFREYFSYWDLKEIGFSDRLIRFIYDISPGNVQFFVFEHFMHFAAVSAETADHAKKVRCLRQYLDDILD